MHVNLNRRVLALLAWAALLPACGQQGADEPEVRQVFGSAHEFDASLDGVQRLWAQQAERQLAAGLRVSQAELPLDVVPAASATSAGGIFQGEISPGPETARRGIRLDYTLRLQRADGRALNRPRLQMAGGMPLHSHGLPTQPRISAGADGSYTISGVRFTMPGWWQLAVGISDTEQNTFDLLTFDIFVPP